MDLGTLSPVDCSHVYAIGGIGTIAVGLWGVCLVSLKKIPGKIAIATFLAHVARVYAGLVLETANHLYCTVKLAVAAIGVISLWKLRGQSDARYDKLDFLYCELAFLMLVRSRA
jgi:hypothetical protein